MSFLKKNLLFCVFVTICLIVFLAGGYLAFNESSKVGKSERSLSTAQARLTSLLNATPALTDENVAAAGQNVSNLEEALAGIREDLQRGASLTTTTDGVSVIAGIQQYISKFQKAAAAAQVKNENGELVPITIPKDFAFGFQEYLKTATPPSDPEKASLLDKQRQILSYMMTQLIAAAPQSIDGVEREIPGSADKGGFVIDEAISAAVPGAIDTIAYKLSFSGYTDSLRAFLNTLAGFELPIVVRSIEVKRPSGKGTVVAKAKKSPNDMFDVFGVGGNAKSADKADEGPTPVIEDNISQFTVILEFIEVVLPEKQNQEVSDSV